MRLLENKIAVITGGGRGIGKAIASQYSEQGATVVIAEFDENSGKNTAEKLEDTSLRLISVMKMEFPHFSIMLKQIFHV